jgi:hypothetical protein
MSVARITVLHTLGGIVGGASMAGLCWLALTPVRTILPTVVGIGAVVVVATVAALADLRVLNLQRQNRQVPQRWFKVYGVERAYAMYGLWLGAGLATNVSFAVEYLVFIGAAVLLPLPAALVAGAIFGLIRTGAAGPIGVFPRMASTWTGIFRVRGNRLPILSALGSSSVAAAMVVLYVVK